MRMQSVKIEVFRDVAKLPYVEIVATTGDESGTQAPALEFTLWAHDVSVVDHRRAPVKEADLREHLGVLFDNASGDDLLGMVVAYCTAREQRIREERA